MSQSSELSVTNAAKKGAPVEKVTAFILGERNGVEELLLLHHPYAGIQIPAGTVEVAESIMDAAQREAREESGLEGLVWGDFVGEEHDELPPDRGLVAESTPVYVRPDLKSNPMGSIRRGFTIGVKRVSGDFLQIHYAETDRYPDAQYMSFELLGWVPAHTITAVRVRHFAWLRAPENTPVEWTVYEDYNNFTLRWHSLGNLPELVAPQAPWLRFLSNLPR